MLEEQTFILNSEIKVWRIKNGYRNMGIPNIWNYNWMVFKELFRHNYKKEYQE